MSQVSIVGAYNSKFGALVKKNRETGEVTDLRSMLRPRRSRRGGAPSPTRGSPGQDVDGVWVGSCAPGPLREPGAPGLVRDGDRSGGAPFQVDDPLRGRVRLRLGRPLRRALRHRGGAGRGWRSSSASEKMNLLDTKGVTHALATCSYWPDEGGKGITFPCLFARVRPGATRRTTRLADASARAHARDRRGARLPQRRSRIRSLTSARAARATSSASSRRTPSWASRRRRTRRSPRPCASTTARSSPTAPRPSSSCGATTRDAAEEAPSRSPASVT